MNRQNGILVLLGVVVIGALVWSSVGQRTLEPAPEPVSSPPLIATEAPPQVPHYHASLKDAQPLPKIMPASNFRIPVVAKAYQIAARIPEVLAQQPCYCWCDKMGHGSLVDCFADEHGASCATCVQEAILADRMTRAGKTPAQIREAIIRGEWERVSLE